MRKYKILVISDEPSKYLWDFYQPGRLSGYDMILSCGDLPAEYLSFVATFANCPVLYVHGNHDEKYLVKPPEGCVNIDGRFYIQDGLRILGLGGSIRYKPGPFQYTQNEMYWRYIKVSWKLWLKKGLDILMTHSPAKGINDRKDKAHEGFEVFKYLIDKYHPIYFIHGHVHMSYGNQPRITYYQGTTIINAFHYYVLEFEK